MAGWVTMVGSVLILFGLFETVGNLRSLETRERVERMLSEPPLEGTGFTYESWVSFVHGVSLVGGAAAVSAGILGFFVLQRHAVARIVLSVLAVPLFFVGFVTSDLITMLVAVTATMLWSRPARDWFAGRPWVPQTIPSRGDKADRGGRRDLDDPSSAQPPSPPQSPWEQPPGERPPGEPASGEQDPEGQRDQHQPPAWGQLPVTDRPVPSTGDARPHAGFGTVTERPVVPAGRPPALVIACALTWLSAGVVAVGFLVAGLGLLLEPSLLEESYAAQDLAEAGMTLEQARTAVIGASVIFGVWALVAVVLAVFAYLGHEWGRLVLVVSASSAAVMSLLLAVSAGLMGVLLLLPVVACVATVVLLLRPEVSAWVRARSVR